MEREALTAEELETMTGKNFATGRLAQVRDIFLFSCFTGLAYADLQKLKRSEISTGIDGGKWIFTKRQKTDTASRIPILPMAEEILVKYADHPQCKAKYKVLPILSNVIIRTPHFAATKSCLPLRCVSGEKEKERVL